MTQSSSGNLGSQKNETSNTGQSTPDGKSGVNASSKHDPAGVSDFEIDLLRSGLPGNIYQRNAPNSDPIPENINDRVEQLLRGQSELLELYTSGADREALLEHTVLLAQRVLAPVLCSIRLVDINSSAISPESEGLAGDSRPKAANPPSGNQVYEALGNGATEALKGARDFASRHGIHVCWSHPILAPDGKLLGTITFYRNAPGEPDSDDRRIMDVVATMAQFAIQTTLRDEALHSANERFTSLAASIPGVVYQRRVTTGGDIAYTYISEGALDIFGVSAENILADPDALFDCHGPEYRADFRERLLEASRKLEMWDVEAQIVTANGEEKWTHAIARPHLDRDGSVLWDGVILDATRIKQAEYELRSAKESAEAANRAKTTFLAQISHELRTPLNAVIGFAEMLSQQHFGPLGHHKYDDYANHIKKSGRHLLDVINSILEFTDLETGNAVIRESKIDLAKVIGSVAADTRSAAKAKNIEISVAIYEDFPLVLGDEEKLGFIFQTLISNGVKFTPDGGKVRIEGRRDEDGNVAIAVIDTGIGIAPDDIPKVFQPFAQIDDELSRKYEGIGLGVSLSVAMAEIHGGSISVDSKLGHGTKVVLTLPMSRVVT